MANPLNPGAPEFNPVPPEARPLPPRPLTSSRPRAKPPVPTQLARLKQGATPFLIGAAVGGGLMIALRGTRKPPKFTLFEEPKSSFLGKIAKVALLAAGRTLLRRVATRAIVKAASPA